jgi:hypothetical protein
VYKLRYASMKRMSKSITLKYPNLIWYQSLERATHVVFIFFFSLKLFLKHLLLLSNGLFSAETTSTETNPNTTEQPTQQLPPINTQQLPPINTQQLPPVTLISSFAQSITMLNKGNFMTWRRLVESFFRGHNLYGFIDRTNTPSPQISTSPRGTLTISTDPDTVQWLCQDQLVLSILMSSISDEMLP